MATPGPVILVPSSTPELGVTQSLPSSSAVSGQPPSIESVTLDAVPIDRTHTPTRGHIRAHRPWWRPPARNFRPHPGNHTIDSFFTTTSLSVIQESSNVHSESLPHYWFRALNYLLRIPLREFVGNISRPYDPTAPLPLPDVPLAANIIDTQTNQSFTNPYTGLQSSAIGQHNNMTESSNTAISGSISQEQTTTSSRSYISQIRKNWRDRTWSMSWSLSTALFTSILCTIVAIAALVLNWKADCTYLKVYLILFVVRKWIVTFIMADRALYRLPLGLTEPDPDIDDERYNGIAIYMSNLFTWHGYVMLLFGSFYVFFYGASHYMTSAPAITGVAIGFACMGLVPFFTLLALLLAALILLYTFYIVFVCVIWPLEKFGLSRRRAISRRNGGYRSNGTTNTTDIREVERTIGNVDNVRGGGLGGVDKIKITPAMAAIPIVIYRKPKVKQTDNTTSEVKVSSKQKEITDQSDVQSENTNTNVPTETMEVIQDTGDSKKHQKVNEGVETTSVDIVKSSSKEDLCSISTSDTPNISKSPQPIAGDGYVAITMDSSNNNHNDAINKVPSGLSSISDSVTGLPQSHNAISRSRSSSTSTGNSGSSWVNIAVSHTTPTSSFIPCATGQEMTESEARMRLSTPTLLSTVASLKPKDFGQKSASNNKSVTIDNHDVASNTNNRGQYMNTGHINSTISREDGIYETTTGSESGFDSKSATSNDLSKDSPTINDEECAICLYDFEDGDELRHLYCDHFFHRSCVDKWLSKNAFCPKCKRSI